MAYRGQRAQSDCPGEATIQSGRAPRRMQNRDLLDECAENTARFFLHAQDDPSYCFELFRRALTKQDEEAWYGLIAQYTTLVGSWIQRHPAFRVSGETNEYFLNRAFEKLWLSVDAKKFKRFDGLACILRYLQMCVHSVIIDHQRANSMAALQTRLVEHIPDSHNPGVEHRAFEQVQQERLWKYLHDTAKDEQERVCMRASFMLGLKPGQILEHFPQAFSTVDEIYLIKQNVIARIRRDPTFETLVYGND